MTRYSAWTEPRWPSWKKVKDRWSDHRVRDVGIRRFQVGTDHGDYPWFDLTTGRQYFGNSNPQVGTAYHLCCSLARFSNDLHIAYKLYAFLRAEEMSIPYGTLGPIFQNEQSHLSHWWNGNAVHVLPPLEYDWAERDKYVVERDAKWTEVVDKAAAVWGLIAEQWAVIRIPDWMDRDDPDLTKYWELVRANSEARERAEYERLKKKYET